MPLKTTSAEEEYFAREEAIKLRKLAQQKKKGMSDEEKRKLKELHYMHCPKCGMEMKTIQINKVDIDKCFACGGLYFDDGELEKVTQRASKFFQTVGDVFKAD
jgi:uncharacterized protein